MNQEQRNAQQRESRKLNGNLHTKKYEKTKNGFLMRLYRNMESRVKGIQKIKAHLYEGKSLLTRDEFYAWTEANAEFHKLFKEWEDSNYERRLTPSVDRIDSSLGYEIHNMEWIPFHENCRRGALAKLKLYYGK
jgi:DNA-binding GntR family transcriptional regulator